MNKMELNYTATTIAKLEEELDCKLIDLFINEEASTNTALSTRKMLALISAGCDNDYEKANEIFMKELSNHESEFSYGDIFLIIVKKLQDIGFLPREKVDAQKTQKLNHGKELSEKLKASESNGKTEK
jgi:hypothetical protein